MQIRGVHYTRCSQCRAKMGKGMSLQRWFKDQKGTWHKVCSHCYSSMGSPEQLANVIAEREREQRAQRRRDTLARNRSRQSTKDKARKRKRERNHFQEKKKRALSRKPGPNQESLF